MKHEDIFEALLEGFNQAATESGRHVMGPGTDITLRGLAYGLEKLIAQIQAPDISQVAVEILRHLMQGKVVIQQPSKEDIAQWLKELTSQP